MILQFTNVSCTNNWAGAWLKTEAYHIHLFPCRTRLSAPLWDLVFREENPSQSQGSDWLKLTHPSLLKILQLDLFFRWICCWQWMTEISKKPHAHQWKCPSSALKVWAHLRAPGRKLPSKPIFNGATSLILHCSTKLKAQLWNINCFWVRSYTQW